MVRNTTAALFSLACLIALPALAQDDLMARARQQFEPIPATPPELPGNPTTPAKVELGKMLFFEPRLSASHIISCNSCHNLGLGGADTQSTSIGHAGSMALAMRPRSSMRCSIRPSSGMAGPKISNSRPVGRWSIRWRWPRPRRMWPSS